MSDACMSSERVRRQGTQLRREQRSARRWARGAGPTVPGRESPGTSWPGVNSFGVCGIHRRARCPHTCRPPQPLMRKDAGARMLTSDRPGARQDRRCQHQALRLRLHTRTQGSKTQRFHAFASRKPKLSAGPFSSKQSPCATTFFGKWATVSASVCGTAVPPIEHVWQANPQRSLLAGSQGIRDPRPPGRTTARRGHRCQRRPARQVSHRGLGAGRPGASDGGP